MKLAVVICLLAAGEQTPVFDRYKIAEEKFAGRPAAPILRTRLQRQFRAMIQDAAKEGPNFAGHYTIAQWGCGAGCVSMAVVESKSGRTFDGPFTILGFDLDYAYEGGEEQLEYRPDSRLLVARGCPGEKDCGTYYYEWSSETFRLLRKVPGVKKGS